MADPRGFTAVAAAMSGLPDVLRHLGWWSEAHADDADIADSYNGLAAMVWPGNDPYSVAQGEWDGRPGAVAAKAGHYLTTALDSLVAEAPTGRHAERATIPLSRALAGAMNTVALTVDPAAVKGHFRSPFSRLAFPDKAIAWRVLEDGTAQVADRNLTHSAGLLRFLFGLVPALVAFHTVSHIDPSGPVSRRLKYRPLGWDHCGQAPLGGNIAPPP